jgi:HEAT repeat protein
VARAIAVMGRGSPRSSSAAEGCVVELRAVTERLRSLGAKRPTPEARSEVVAALSSKWEGVQAVAAEVLAGWGDRECVGHLRQFLIRCFEREYGWAIRGVVVRALRRVVSEEDAGWVLDLYFSPPGLLPKHELLWLVAALPLAAARGRLVAALRDPRWDNRQAAVKAIGNMDYPDRQQLLRPLWADSDDNVRRSARLLAPDA